MAMRPLLEPNNKEIRIKRKTRKAVCQFKKSDGQSVGLGCLLFAPQVEVKHFSKFFILTTTKVIPNSDFSEGEYEVEFAKGSTSKTFDLKSITKSVLVRLASGLAVIFLNLGCSELNHHWCFRSKKCTLLSKSSLTTADQNKVKQFCYIGNKCYNHVESNGRDILQVVNTESNSTTGSNDFPEENCNGSVILAVIDGNVKAVGIFNIQSDTQEPKVISPVWIKSRIDAIFEEPPPDTGETPPSDTGQLSPGTEKAPPAATGAPSADIGEPPAGTGESPPEQAEEPSAADTADGLIQTIPRRGAGERSDLTSGSDAPLENTDGSKVKPKSDAEPEADPTQTGQVAGEPPGMQERVDTVDCGNQTGLHPQAVGRKKRAENPEPRGETHHVLVDAGVYTNESQVNTRLSTKVTSIPLKVYSKVCVKLNVKRRVRFDDFRMLADNVGLSRDETDFIEQNFPNPTDEILKTWSTRSREATAGKLIELLQEDGFERIDVVEILEKWVFET